MSTNLTALFAMTPTVPRLLSRALALAALLVPLVVVAAPEARKAEAKDDAETPAGARTCKSMGLTPSPPDAGPILRRYYRETEGVGGHGCWVHPGETGKDFVVTPWSWGAEPTPGKQGLIDAVHRAIKDARTVYEQIGELDLGVFYLLNDVHENAETYWLVPNQCWVEAGPRGGVGGWREDTAHLLPGLVAHEVAHCFLMANIPYYTYEAYDEQLDNWWDESGAHYFGSLVYPELNYEHEDARAFDLDGASFEQPYNAYAMLQSYALAHDPITVLVLLSEIFTVRDRDARMAYLQSTGFDRDFHNFVFDHYHAAVPDAPGPGLLPSEAPDGVEFMVDEYLFEDIGAIQLLSIPEARLSVVHLEAPENFDITLWPPAAPGLHASLESNVATERNWTRKYEYAGECDAPFSANILLSHLDRRPIKNQEIRYTLKPMAPERCEPRQCEVGVWEEITGRVQDARQMDAPTVAHLESEGEIDVRLLPEAFAFHDAEQVNLPQGAQMTRSYGFAGPRLMISAAGTWQLNDPHLITFGAPGAAQMRNVVFSGETGTWQSGDSTLLQVQFERTTEEYSIAIAGMGDNSQLIDENQPPRQPRAYAIECTDNKLILRGTGQRQFVDPRTFTRIE